MQQSNLATSQSQALNEEAQKNSINSLANPSHYTPIAKQKTCFKSPAPSNKKCNQFAKSPIGTTQMRLYGFQMNGMPSNEKWTVSPVCSRLREHITMMN